MDGGERSGDTCSYQLHRDEIPTARRDETMADDKRTLETNAAGYWQCPHQSLADHKRCIFHCPISERPADQSATETLITTIRETASHRRRDDRRRRKQFIGATFETLALEEEVFDTTDNFPIDLRKATIEHLQAEHSTLRSPLDLRGATIDRVSATEAQWERVFAQQTEMVTAAFDQATIDRAYFDDAQIDRLRFYFATVQYGDFKKITVDRLNFLYGEFGEMAFFDATIDVATFFGAQFEGGYFDDASFTYLILESAHGGQYHLDGVDAVGISLTGIDAELVDLADGEYERTRITRADINRLTARDASLGLVSLDDNQIGRLECTDITISGGLSLAGTTVEKAVHLTPTVDASMVGYVSCRDAVLAGGHLGQPSAGDIVYDFTDATLGTIEVTGNDRGPLADRLLFLRTDYDGFEFTKLPDLDLDIVGFALDRLPTSLRTPAERHRQALNAVTDLHPAIEGEALTARGKSNTVNFEAIEEADTAVDTLTQVQSRLEESATATEHDDGPSEAATIGCSPTAYSTLETTYLKAKNGASAVGDSTAAGRFFEIERQYRRKRHWDAVTDQTLPIGHRLRRMSQWARNGLLALTTGYGERPWRPIGISLLMIVGFGGGYAYIGRSLAGIDNPGLVDYLVFSFQSFVTFIIGPPSNTAALDLRVLSAVEGFLGAFFVALFVFTLTRQVHR